MSEQHNEASGLFSIFFVSIYTLFLFVYTCYHFCGGAEAPTTQPVARSKKKKQAGDVLRQYLTRGNLVLLALWVVWACALVYTSYAVREARVFDPFDILGVSHDASERDIKRAYRKLSLLYHPDKNPDPQAAAYFASYITKAYAALTDEVSRKNYEKHGHPDGPQGMNIGVALPAWMFSRDRKAAPLMLLGLIGVCILLPLSLISWYMLSSNKYTGPNRIMNETLIMFLHSKFCVKESQALVRIPETLMCAMEFITLFTPPEHEGPMEELRKAVAPVYPELMARDKKAFWQRRGSVVKAHMLLLAHLERMADEVPAPLLPDLRYVLTKAPPLCEEMVKIALIPRTSAGTGWMTPAVAGVEMMQCISQAVPVSARKLQGKSAESVAPLLQLPHADSDTLKRLKKRRINALRDLQDLSEDAQSEALTACGYSPEQVEEAVTFLAAVPQLAVVAECVVDGEDEVMEGDPVTCRVRVLLRRRAHKQEGYRLTGKAVRALTPHNPCPRDESWWVFLASPGDNAVYAHTKVTLMEAEKAALATPDAFDTFQSDFFAAAEGAAGPADSVDALAAAGGKARGGGGGKLEDLELGQEVVMMFAAPAAGRHDLSLLIMSDAWMGADATFPIRLRVLPLTRAVAEGRGARSQPVVKKWADSDSERSDGDEGSAVGSGSEGEEEDDDDDYDSEETGEEESDGGGGGGGDDDDADADVRPLAPPSPTRDTKKRR